MLLFHKREIHVRVVGGLGNQLFVYFAGRYLSRVSSRELVLNIDDASRVHSFYDLRSFREISGLRIISAKYPTASMLKRIMHSLRYRLPIAFRVIDSFLGNYVDQGLSSNVLRSQSRRGSVKFTGYFQDFEYIDKLQELKAGEEVLTLFNEPRINKNLLTIHIRRGDFINEKTTHGCLKSQWYHQAISHQLSTAHSINEIRIYSNDDEWVTSNLEDICPKTHIRIEIVKFDSKQDPAISFLAFGSGQYKICSNSTYSLLAARLFPGVSVVPYPYNRSGNFKALEKSSPTDWIRIPSIWEE